MQLNSQSLSPSLSVSQSVSPLVLKGPKVPCAPLLMRYKADPLLMQQLQAYLWALGLLPLLSKATAMKDTLLLPWHFPTTYTSK